MSYIVEPGESPDFILESEGCCLGLEVTQLFHPADQPTLPRRAVENLRSRVVSEAQSLFEKTAKLTLNVAVAFNPSQSIARTDVTPLARRLADLVTRNLPEQHRNKSEEYNWENRDWFPEEIHRVSVTRLPQLRNSHWYSPDVEFVPPCTVELVQDTIEKKNAKIGSYVKLVRECWLLIVLDDFRLSGAFTIAQDLLDHCYLSKFKKIFLFQSFSRRVYPLKLRSE